MSGCHVKPEQMFNLIFGFHSQWLEEVDNANATAGDTWLTYTEVPPNEIWIATSVGGALTDRAPTAIEAFIYDGSSYYCIASEVAPVTRDWWKEQGWWILVEGDTMRIRVRGCNAGDDTWSSVTGFKMRVVQ